MINPIFHFILRWKKKEAHPRINLGTAIVIIGIAYNPLVAGKRLSAAVRSSAAGF